MKLELLDFICCPECKEPLLLKNEVYVQNEIKDGDLKCGNAHAYKIVNFIPRFVKVDAYTSSFSYEWDRFSETQLDAKIGYDLSENQFQGRIDFPLNQIKGKFVLDAGCGMGRYADVVRKYGGVVFGIDLSYAVDSAFRNIGFAGNVHIMQADIFKPPF